MDIFVNGFRTLMFFIDNIVYSIIPVLYKLLVYLSEVNLYSGDPDDPLTALISRVYVLLGIFMLFKVSFSLLQYLVDPNAFSDSSKGFGKLVTNTLVVIVLLVSVPSIFSYAMNLQRIIVQNNLIGQLVLGTGGSTNYSTTDAEGNVQKIDSTQAEMMAKDVQFMVFGTFFSVNTDKITECADGPIFGSAQMAKSKDCLEALDGYFASTPDISGNGVTLDSFFLKYDGNSVIDDRNFSHFDKLLWWKVDNEYAVNYLPFISTAAGIYLVFLLISFCIDVALRAIKLAFLQMIAPIAIVSYIDPKESISDSKLRKWINECAKTYFSLFLRLATIFLVMLLISIISSKVLANNSELASGINDNEMSFWIYLFLILGAFVFAKKVPEMIENIFGIKFSGELGLNHLKTIGNNALATGIIGGVAGGVVGAGANALGAFATSRNMGRSLGRSALSALGGAGSGFARGGFVGARAKGKNVVSKAAGTVGDLTRSMALRDGTHLKDRIGARMRNAVGAQSKYEVLEQRAKLHDSFASYADQMEERAKDQLKKKSDDFKLLEEKREYFRKEYREGRMTDNAFSNMMNQLKTKEDKMVQEYIDRGGITAGSDAELASMRIALERINKDGKLGYDVSDWAHISGGGNGITTAKDQAKAAARGIRDSDEYENAKAVHEAQQSGLMQKHIGGGGSH